MNRPLVLIVAALLVAPAISIVGGCASAKGSSAQEKRAYTLRMRDAALAELYTQAPEAKQKIQNAAGYGVFSSIGTNIIFVTTGGGFGVVHDNTTGKDTYMKMGELGVGIGIGVTDFRAVFVFYDEHVLNTFIRDGWEFGGEAQAVAQAGDQGGGVTGAENIHSGMEVYQFTKNGIALSASVSGTKYWKDGYLNSYARPGGG